MSQIRAGAAAVAVDRVEIDALPPDWRSYPAPAALAAFGERWLRTAGAAVLSVPSVVIPHERNYILNPGHADFATVVPQTAEPFSFDPGMWKTGR